MRKTVLWMVAGLIGGMVMAAVALPVVRPQSNPVYRYMSPMMRQAANSQEGQQMLSACTSFMQGYFSNGGFAR